MHGCPPKGCPRVPERLSEPVARLLPMAGRRVFQRDLDTHPVRRVEADRGHSLAPGDWPATIPAVAQLLSGGLDLGPGATFLVGENGSGKSTIVEAVAVAYGLSPEGGSTQGCCCCRHQLGRLGGIQACC